MLALHDRSRRGICLALFGLLCVGPTVAVLAAGVWFHRPGHVADCQAELAQQLGLDVTLEQVAYPLPGITRLTGVTLSDPESGEPLIKARFVELDRRGPSWRLEAAEVELCEPGDSLWNWCHELVRGRSRSPRIILSVRDLTWASRSGNITCGQLAGWLDSQPASTRAGVQFRLGDTESGEPAFIELTRNRQVTPAVTQVQVRTGSQPIPCRLAGSLAHSWGREAGFAGELRWTATSGDLDLYGKLTGIDLFRLTSERNVHRLTGLAEVTFTRLEARQGRIERTAGTLTTGPGVVSGGLVRGMAEDLRLPLADHLARAAAEPAVPQWIEYQKLGCQFTLDGLGLSLSAIDQQAGSPSNGVIIHGEEGPLVGQTPAPQPIAALVRALIPASGVSVPLARETDWLVSRLPLGSAPTAAADHGKPERR